MAENRPKWVAVRARVILDLACAIFKKIKKSPKMADDEGDLPGEGDEAEEWNQQGGALVGLPFDHFNTKEEKALYLTPDVEDGVAHNVEHEKGQGETGFQHEQLQEQGDQPQLIKAGLTGAGIATALFGPPALWYINKIQREYNAEQRLWQQQMNAWAVNWQGRQVQRRKAG